MKKQSKTDIENQIEEIFSNNPSKKEILKAKKLAMSRNIKLGKLKRKFCKKCHSIFKSNNSQIRIKKPIKIIKCKKCGNISRYKLE